MPPRADAQVPERIRSLTLDAPALAVEEVVPIAFDTRLSIVTPAPIRLAVPGSPDVVAVHVQGALAVVSLVDSEFVRRARPVTNLTLLLTDGTAVAVRLAAVARPAEMPHDMLRFERGPGFGAATTKAAVDLLTSALSDPAGAPPELRAAVEAERRAAEVRALDALLVDAARAGLSSERVERRTKRGFIYLAGVERVRLGRWLLLGLTLENHSQPTFEPARVRVQARTGEWLPDDLVEFRFSAPSVAADGRVRRLVVRLPAEGIAAPAAIEVCEPQERRCVTLEVGD
jgi:hypothetical protein